MSAASKVGLIAICLGGVVAANTPGPQAPKKLLFLTHAGLYKHTSLGPAEMAVASWGEEAGYEVTSVQGYLQEQEELDLSIITAEYLAQFDGVMMMTNGNLPMRDEQKRALLRRIEQVLQLIDRPGVEPATQQLAPTFQQHVGHVLFP